MRRENFPAVFRACVTTAILFLGPPAVAGEPAEIQMPGKLQNQLKSFEPSAAVYLQDLNAYLITSDDTDKEDTPYLFLMNDKGKVSKTPLLIGGVDKLTDMESMSQDGEYLYVLASLGKNKKGKVKPERNLFVRAKRSGQEIEADGSVDLRNMLLKAWKKSNDPVLADLSGEVEDKLNIESHFVMDGDLYVGLKSPQPAPGQALILNLGPTDGIFSRKGLGKLKVWRTVDFESVSSEADFLSDLSYSEDRLVATTTVEGGGGRIWSLDLKSDRLKVEREFREERPEGIAFNEESNEFTVVFDQGSDTGLFLHTTF